MSQILLICALLNIVTHATEENFDKMDEINEELIGKTLTNIYIKAEENAKKENVEKNLNIEEMSSKELQKACISRHLNKNGNKKQLQNRLKKALSGEKKQQMMHVQKPLKEIDEEIITKTLQTNINTKSEVNLEEGEEFFTPGEYKIKKLQSAATATIEVVTTNDDIKQMYTTGDIVYVVEVQNLKNAKRIRGKLDNHLWISLQNTQTRACWVKRLENKIVDLKKPSQNLIKETLTNIYAEAETNAKLPPEEEECMVCYERFPVALRFPCGHDFCAMCSEIILKASNRVNCPKCRTLLPRLLYTDWLDMIHIYPSFITPQISLKNLQHVFPLICSSANLTTVTKCVNMGVDVNTKGFHEVFPLTCCSQINVVKYLVNKGADVNPAQSGATRATPFGFAAHNGNLPVVKYLFKKGALINGSSLFLSSQNGHLSVVEFLVQHGANVNKPKFAYPDFFCVTTLFMSSQNGHLPVVKYLVKNGAKVNQPRHDGMTPLMISSQIGHLEIVQYLLNNGADVNQSTNDGETALVSSCIKGNLEICQYLVENGANVNQVRHDGSGALYAGSIKGNLAIVKNLVQNGANVNQACNDGVTPLYASSQNNYLEIVQYLIKNGANINQARDNGMTPLGMACHNGHLSIVKYLIKNGADVNQNDYDGGTPLFMAIYCKKYQVAKFLLRNDANIRNTKLYFIKNGLLQHIDVLDKLWIEYYDSIGK
jgi:ankyrin repeat protein